MNKKRCRNCGGKFDPKKHIVNQKYCSKEKCQRARIKKWVKHRKHDKNYKAYRKEIQDKWKSNNPDYWKRYKKHALEKPKVLKVATDEINLERPTLKILVEKNVLVNLQKMKTISCNCRLILTHEKAIKTNV